MRFLVQISLVAAGSAIGGLLRWGVSVWSGRLLGSALPWGTFLINISGSFFLGWILTVLAERMPLAQGRWLRPDDLRLMLAVGFAGAYTTFSTFEWESNSLIRDGQGLAGFGYMLASVAAGLVALRLGMVLGKAM
ncbi:MAG TPA: CrcB family protein [Pirellulales bacterium]|nr:CrcB family protein [Pirellulales bacterium]